jgi:phage I-like protein
MTRKTQTATMAALDLPISGEVPDWIHLLPAAQGELRTFDGRGPYHLTDASAVIAASLAADPRDGGGLLIDENHALELSASKGGPSPSRGRIVEMQPRADGIWGRVDWNDSGRALLAERAYRGISPVIIHDAKGVILRIKNAALVNYPNLRGQVALNQEDSMNFMERLAQQLGLASEASEDDILAALPGASANAAALQSQIAEYATALGVSGADHQAILTAAQAQRSGTSAEMTAMQSELTQVSTALTSAQSELAGLRQDKLREKAETFVDRAIAEARPGVKARRDWYIARHMEDVAGTEATILALPSFGPGQRQTPPPALQSQGNDLTALSAEAQGRVLHDRAKAWQSEQSAKGIAIAFADAVHHVQKEVLL